MRDPLSATRPKFLLSSRGDAVFRALLLGLSCLIVLVFVLALWQLTAQSWPALRAFGLKFLVTNVWNPVTGQFGAASMIAGTLLTAFLALVISVPLALASALFVAEYAPKWLAGPVGYLVELLAAVPSVVYGLWALFVIKPVLQAIETRIFTAHPEVAASCFQLLSTGRTSAQCFWYPPSLAGNGLLLAVIILTVMILPYTASVARDVIRLVPQDQREAMYALGATRWEVIRLAVLPSARAGIAGGVILALGRALGETLAVAMVIGNTPQFVNSLWGATSTMASTIALQFGDASASLHRAAIVELGLLLFLLSVVVNLAARFIIARLTPGGRAA